MAQISYSRLPCFSLGRWYRPTQTASRATSATEDCGTADIMDSPTTQTTHLAVMQDQQNAFPSDNAMPFTPNSRTDSISLDGRRDALANARTPVHDSILPVLRRDAGHPLIKSVSTPCREVSSASPVRSALLHPAAASPNIAQPLWLGRVEKGVGEGPDFFSDASVAEAARGQWGVSPTAP
ncbi:hypothetical protein K458DRAFT_432455 [Lentithecium fluviatile CBS 122367]|uniref:Uncharacterized protein n=1 Tax=Lentithecium fluviatile CBS 122367 TaxID=1168545 RepID=A0A6G1IY75_9PLEO|nr:hypothetical protein K458DRAFT_432455 [Lentithecium fluviatile CBS 122367]